MKTNKPNFAEELAKVFLEHKTATEMQDFLQGALTPDELKAIAMRLEIIRLLKAKKLSQHEIAKVLGVGVATVTRGMRELKQNHFKNI